jgi:predicted RNase H-like HicB family nuclease
MREVPAHSRGTIDAEMTESISFTIVYEQGEDGWIVAQVKEVPGAISQGRDRAEARENVIDALRLMLSPEPDEAAADSEAIELTLAS